MPFWLAAFARLVPDLGEPASQPSCGSNFLCVEWEYQRVTLPRGTPRNIAQRLLTDAAEREHWELDRLRLYPDGRRKVVLRRRIMRVRSTLVH